MEEIYHYLWKTRIRGSKFTDVDGRAVEVLDPGVHNHDSGPDFFNSKLKIDGVEWVGNVEIHVKASDWFRHGHTGDPAYDNVILHVVGRSDKRVEGPDGQTLPQVELSFPEKFLTTYRFLSESNNGYPLKCASRLANLPDINKTDWLETLSVERLQQKAAKVNELNGSLQGDWESTCFIMLARGLGFGLNSDPFELLARSIPLRVLHHHSDNLFQLQALLFGQAAMLDATLYMFDEYFQSLCREYYFLSRKYSLKPIRIGMWKYSRTRPQNFPHRRIAFLASACADGFSIFSKLLQSRGEIDKVLTAFDMKAEGYWSHHYSFDTDATGAPVELSKASKMLLAINVAVPVLYAYAAVTGNLELAERAMGMMEKLPAENNSILRDWRNVGLTAEDASRSQALLHLRKEYCDKNRCFQCRFGHHYLKSSFL